MLSFVFFGIISLFIILGVSLLNKIQRLKESSDKITALNLSLEEMDEQA